MTALVQESVEVNRDIACGRHAVIADHEQARALG